MTEEKKVIDITVANPSAEELAELCGAIQGSYPTPVDVRGTTFNFKKSKGDDGQEYMRHPVTLALPYPSVEGIVAIIEAGGKQLDLLQEAMAKVVDDAARNVLYTDTALTAATFPVDKVSWEAIANQPKAQRKGGGIPKEVWAAFSEDYVAVMPEVTGKSITAVTNMAKILVNKLMAVKTNIPVLQLVVEQLAVYAEHTENMEAYGECVEFLLDKAETLMNVTDEDLLTGL